MLLRRKGFDLEALEDMDLSELLPSLQHHNTDPDSTSNLQDMIASALSSFTSKKKTNDVKKKKKKPIVTPDSITPMKSYEHLLWPTFRSYPQVRFPLQHDPSTTTKSSPQRSQDMLTW